MDLLGQAKNGPRTKLFGTGQKVSQKLLDFGVFGIYNRKKSTFGGILTYAK